LRERKITISMPGIRKPRPLHFAYYMEDNGTGEDREKDKKDLLRLVDIGYVAFRDCSSGRTAVYRPFEMGARLPGNSRKEEYRLNCWCGPGEC
jgi:hypothetical protein